MIKGRIKSVKNISQITKAMELVSAAKMRKSQSQALSSRAYSKLASSLLENLAGKVDKKLHPLLEIAYETQESVSKTLVILITPDKGLAGALNMNLINKVSEIIRGEGNTNIDFVTIGKKGTEAVRRMGFNIIANFPAKDRDLSVFDAKPVVEIAVDEYTAQHYQKVFIVFTDFISTLNQKASILQLLPLSKTAEADTEEYLFEPNPDEVLEDLVYRAIEFAVYQCLVEAVASEHSARMVAMRNANEAASDLIEELQLTYNQARQAGITKELSEISAAKLAMEG